MKYSPLVAIARIALISTFFCHEGAAVARAGELLQPENPVALTGTHGKFDFLSTDLPRRRLLAAHPGNGSLDVIDLDTRQLIKSVATGNAQSSVVDAKTGRYYVAESVPPQLVTVDAKSLEVIETVALSGPGDLLTLDTNTGKVYVGHDDGQELWVVDPAVKGAPLPIALQGEAPEDLAFDASHHRLFQSMKKGDLVNVIDVARNTVDGTWPTAPVQLPHGMAVIPEEDALAIAGGNGKLVLMSRKDGRIIAETDIPPRVDQIAYDAGLHHLYCASGTGKIGIVSVKNGTLRRLGEVDSAEGAHSIAVDPDTHTVWIAYARGEASFVQPFTPTK